MNIVLYNDHIKSPNFGCKLVGNSLRLLLKEKYPTANIIYKPSETFSLIDKGKQTIPDVIIVNGEGSFGQHYKIPDGWKLLSDIFAHYKAPVYLVNVTIQNKDGILSDKHRKLLEKCNKIFTREKLSAEFLTESGIPNSKVYPDAGCYFFKNELPVTKDIDIVFGGGSLFKTIDLEKTKKYVEAFNQLAEQGYSVHLVDFPGNIKSKPKPDVEVLRQYCSSKIKIHAKGTFKDYFNIVKRAKLHVTGRHHGSIMSFMGRTPFITFQSNMWKTEGDQLLYGPFNSFDFTRITTGDLKKLVVDGLNKYPEWRTKLDIRYSKLQSDFGSQIIKI